MRRLTAALAFVLGLAPVLAQTAVPAGQTRAKALLDRDVHSADDVELGEVEDLLIDADGRVVTAVIEIETRLGFTVRYVAVSYGQLRQGDRRVTLSMTREEVRALPAFDYRN